MVPKKVLLAEDDHDDQNIFNTFLDERTDIIIMPMAENGVQLLEILDAITTANNLPDFIILDQNMPKRNGLQTLKFLKEDPKYKHIPVMIYSTYIDQNLGATCKESGAAALMQKPISAEGYNEMIDVFLKSIGKSSKV